jgi:hypothetical protein
MVIVEVSLVRTRIRRATLADRGGVSSSRTPSRESLITAGIVLATSLAFSAVGLLLLGIGGLASLFAVMLLTFGVTGCAQALLIACGRRQPPDDTTGHSARDPRRRAKTKR